jgi:hypothetical protein
MEYSNKQVCRRIGERKCMSLRYLKLAWPPKFLVSSFSLSVNLNAKDAIVSSSISLAINPYLGKLVIREFLFSVLRLSTISSSYSSYHARSLISSKGQCPKLRSDDRFVSYRIVDLRHNIVPLMLAQSWSKRILSNNPHYV